MTTTINEPTQSNSFATFPTYYVNGLQISNDATTPNTKLDIGVGSILDSTQTYQMFTEANIVINGAVNGVNGLDTGTLAASKVYAVYLVADPVTLQPTVGMISLSLVTPLMPFGYSAFALIGFVTTDSSVHFLKGYWSTDDSGNRTFTYDAVQATAVTAGSSTTYANVNLIAVVPNIANTPVQIFSNYIPAVAGNTLSLQAGNATGAQVVITGQVATVHVTSVDTVLAQPVVISTVSSPVVNYKVIASDAVAVDVAGYQYFI